MKTGVRLVVLLIVAMLMRGTFGGYAMPVPMGHITPTVVAMNTDHCHDDAMAPVLSVSASDERPCQLACELASAPAMVQQLVPNLASSIAVWIPVALRLAIADPPAPDHPPPIA